MEFLVRFGWLLANGIAGGASASLFAWYMMSTALTGFDTSQQTLSASMTELRSTLDRRKEITDEQILVARGDLTIEIKGLSQTIADFNTTLSRRLEENSSQLSSLNSTISGVDKRLSESISRQQAFETLVLQRIVNQGPVQPTAIGPIVDVWMKAGYAGAFVKTDISDATMLNRWEQFSPLLQK